MKRRACKLLALLLALVMVLPACAAKEEPAAQSESAQEGFKLMGGFNSKKPAPAATQSQTAPQSAAKPKGDTVAAEVDLAKEFALPDNVLPNLYNWADGAAQYDNDPSELDGNQVFKYKTEMDIVKEYVQMLRSNGYTLVDEYDEFKELHAWGFTCDAAPNADKLEMMFTDTPCHVSIHWTDSSRRKFTMYVSPDIEVCDTGLRRDGSTVDILPQGPSAGAGLIRMADGSYQTSDGRLAASVGTAMVIRDGKTINASARYVKDGGDQFWIEDYYRNEGIFIEAPENFLMQGDMFCREELARWRAIERDKDSLDSFNYDGMAIAIAHGDNWVGPGLNEEYYEALTLRLMYYDKGGDAVFYVYAKFLDDEPGEVEALFAVDTTDTSGTIKNATYLKPGSTVTLKYTHQEYGSSYHTYDWAIVEGADKISISGVGNSCDVTANAPGVATVTVTYGYSKEEPDVLTKIPRTVGHSIVEEYHFIIE